MKWRGRRNHLPHLELRLDQIGAQLLGGWVTRLAPRREREWLDDGKEDPTGPGRGAGHGRRNEGLADGQAVRQPQRALPKPLDKVGSNTITETGLDEPSGEEEGDHDEPDHLVGERPEGSGEAESLGEHSGRQTEKCPRADGERVEDEPRNRGQKNGEKLPRLRCDPDGLRDEEPDCEPDRHGESKGNQLCPRRRRRRRSSHRRIGGSPDRMRTDAGGVGRESRSDRKRFPELQFGAEEPASGGGTPSEGESRCRLRRDRPGSRPWRRWEGRAAEDDALHFPAPSLCSVVICSGPAAAADEVHLSPSTETRRGTWGGRSSPKLAKQLCG